MPRTKVFLDSAAMAELLKSDGVRAEMHRRAELVRAAAEASAPVDTGAYRGGLTVEDDTTDRAVARVGSNVKHSPLVEAKTGNILRALDAAGD